MAALSGFHLYTPTDSNEDSFLVCPTMVFYYKIVVSSVDITVSFYCSQMISPFRVKTYLKTVATESLVRTEANQFLQQFKEDLETSN